jgi:3-hydroxyisobutyrate dehydrogenase-like beta-hydroxyacid dehydrogenase
MSNEQTNEQTFGFIGLGRMGSRMSARLIAAGHRLVTFDVDPQALQQSVKNGASPAKSAAEVASLSDVVFVSLPTPDIVKSVALSDQGVIASSRARIFVDLSTTGPSTAIEVANALSARGITAVDAPVSGGPVGAEKGTLAIMVAAPSAVVEELRPFLSVLGKVFWVGEKPGMGQSMKVINNLLSATAVVATSEAMVMGVKAGLDPALMLDVINASSGRNTATADKFPRCVLPRRFDFGFSTDLLYKDVKLCLDEGERLGVPMMVGNAVRQLMAISRAREEPGADITRIVCALEEWAGVEVKGKSGG